MAYQFIDAYGSVLTADSSFISGVIQRPIVNVGSIVGNIQATITGTPSISGAITVAGGQSSVSGVGVFNTNHIGNGSILTVIPGSVATVPSPGSVSGVGVFNVNHVGNGSILTVIPGSVATAPSPASVSGVGVFNTNHIGNGSIITVWSSPSIVGTYAEDAAHTSGERGIFTLGVRNDAIASFASANLDYTPVGVDSAGRTVVKPFAPDQARISSVILTNNTTSTSLLAAGGAGLRTYVTDIMVTNMGSVATRVSFLDGDNSVMGQTIAPASGGSNKEFATPMRTGGFAQQVHVIMSTAVSTLGVTGLGYYAP